MVMVTVGKLFVFSTIKVEKHLMLSDDAEMQVGPPSDPTSLSQAF